MIFNLFKILIIMMFVGICKDFLVIRRQRSLEDSRLSRLLLYYFGFLFLWTFVKGKVLIKLVMLVLSTRFSFKLIKIIDLELSPSKVSLLWVTFHSPPESSLQQTLNKKVVVSFTKIKFILML